MAERGRVRCESCGHVDAATRVSPGPGWAAVLLWSLGTVALLVGLLVPPLRIGAWVLLVLGGVYTVWFFLRRRDACRHCGSTGVTPLTATIPEE